MTTHKVETNILESSAYERWNSLVERAPMGSVYALTTYLDVLSAVTGTDFKIVGVWKGDELWGGVPLFQIKSPYGICSGPRYLLYYNGIIIKEGLGFSSRLALTEALEAKLRSMRYARIVLNSRAPIGDENLEEQTFGGGGQFVDVRPFQSNGWKSWPSFSYLVFLSTESRAEDSFDKNLRRLVRRAEERGLSFSEDMDFEGFYDLHNEIHLRKGAPLYLSKEAFKTYFERLKKAELVRLFNARDAQGRVVSTQLVLAGKHPVTHSVCAGTAIEELDSGVTAFLRAGVFNALANSGYRANDLTDAALNSVTAFKGQLGGRLVQNTSVELVSSSILRFKLALLNLLRGGQ